jgi:NAD(P)H-dependent FMN reductase
MAKPRILAFAGSAREGSWNKKLVRAGAKAVRDAGGDVTLVDLNDFPIPLYHGDLEAREGVPENARKLKALCAEHDGFLISSPENNTSISALLKNALDWMSRPDGAGAKRAAFQNKPVALLSASPGYFGGVRHLAHVREILFNLELIVLPEPFSLARANDAFGPDGSLKDAGAQNLVAALAQRLVKVTRALAAAADPARAEREPAPRLRRARNQGD